MATARWTKDERQVAERIPHGRLRRRAPTSLLTAIIEED